MEQKDSKKLRENGKSSPSNSRLPPEQNQEEADEPLTRNTNREMWGTWKKSYDFTLTVIGYVLGVHNFWRFPYLCYKYGGVFFIPYGVVMLLIGFPTVFMEFTIGQYFSVGPTEACGKMAPILKGVSYLLAFNSLVNCWLYTMIISLSRLYSSDAASCYKGWETCNNKTYCNTMECFTGEKNEMCQVKVNDTQSDTPEPQIYYNFTCIPVSDFCQVFGAEYDVNNKSCVLGKNNKTFSIFSRRSNAATKHFYGINGLQRKKEVMRKRGGYNPRNPKHYKEGLKYIRDDDSRSGINLKLYALTTWLLIAIFLYEGLLSVSVVTYILSILPFILLILFTGKALALPQALPGIVELFWKREIFQHLSNFEIWADTIIQVVGTTGIGNGVLITLATFNNDTCFTSFLIFFTSGCASLICFCTIGHYINYYKINEEFNKYIQMESTSSSVEFGFIVYTHFLTLINDQRYSIVMFFFMITSFSTDTVLRYVQMALDSFVAIVPGLRHRRFTALLGICCIGFLTIFPLTKNGGLINFLEYEYFIHNFTSPFVTLVQATGFAWIYSASRIVDHAKAMNTASSTLFRWYLIVCLKIVTPLSLLYVLVVKAALHTRVRFNDQKTNPIIEGFAWLFLGVPVLIIVLTVCYQLFKGRKGKWSLLFKPAGKVDKKVKKSVPGLAKGSIAQYKNPVLMKALQKWKQQKLERFKLIPNAPVSKHPPSTVTSHSKSLRMFSASVRTANSFEPNHQMSQSYVGHFGPSVVDTSTPMNENQVKHDKSKIVLLAILHYFEQWPGRFDEDTNDESDDQSDNSMIWDDK